MEWKGKRGKGNGSSAFDKAVDIDIPVGRQVEEETRVEWLTH